MADPREIRAFIADLDGTLLDPGKKITPEAEEAVQRLRDAGILFTVVSGRPPFGMRMHSDALRVKLPISGFNGAEITTPDFASLQRLVIPEETSREIAKFLGEKKLNYWIYRGSDWLVLDSGIPHCANEARNVAFAPSVVSGFDGRWAGITKIVGISDDREFLARCEKEAQEVFRGRANAARSQPYYLDITHPAASKETFVDYFAHSEKLSRGQIATIGDMPSDLPMFRSCGLSIAMGNAPDFVKSQANHVTWTNDKNGFAHAVSEFILTRARDRRILSRA